MAGLAVVTGASSGIGEAYAERLAADGWDLWVLARRADRLEALAQRLRAEHGVEVRALAGDLGREADLERACAAVAQAPVEMLVNNAGLGHYRPLRELEPAAAHELVDVNVLAPVLLSRAAVGGMTARGSGAIINVASLLAFSGTAVGPQMPARAIYAATKSFLVTFSQVLAAEVAEHGVRVQVVCPGLVRSEFHSRQGMDMSAVPRMEARDVVHASLADVAAGTLVSIPGLADLDALARLDGAGRELVGAARTTELPPRYRPGEPG